MDYDMKPTASLWKEGCQICNHRFSGNLVVRSRLRGIFTDIPTAGYKAVPPFICWWCKNRLSIELSSLDAAVGSP